MTRIGLKKVGIAIALGLILQACASTRRGYSCYRAACENRPEYWHELR